VIADVRKGFAVFGTRTNAAAESRLDHAGRRHDAPMPPQISRRSGDPTRRRRRTPGEAATQGETTPGDAAQVATTM